MTMNLFRGTPSVLGPGTAHDRFGRDLHVGDLIVAQEEQIPVLQIVRIEAQMNPKFPAGHILRCVAEFQLFVPSSNATPQIMLVKRNEQDAKPEGVA